MKEFAAVGVMLKQNPSLARIHGSLMVTGGTVQRDVFQENFPEMARVVLAAQAALAAKSKPVIELGFQGHTGTVNCIAISTDGERAASGDDRTIRIWEVPSGKRLAVIDVNTEVTALAISADGKHLLSGGRDRLARLWDLQTNKQIHALRGHTDAVRAVAFAPNGKLAVSGGDDRALRIWDLSTGEETGDLAGHTQAVTSVAWSRDGEHILSGSRDGTVRWWDWETRKKIFVLEGHSGPVLSIAIAPNGVTAISGGNDKTVRHWSLADGKEIFCYKGHENAVVRVQYHAGSREISSSSSQHRGAEQVWRRWDTQNRKEIGARAVGEEYRFGCAAFSPDGRHFLVGGPGGFMRLWSW